MRIERVQPAFVPKRLETELVAGGAGESQTPGFILSGGEIARQNTSFGEGLSRLAGGSGGAAGSCVLVPPSDVANLFASEKQLDLLRSVAGLIAGNIHPHLKTGIDAVWLVYRAAALREEWMKPDRDLGTCLFRLAGVGLGLAAVAGRVYPQMKLGDPWANGLNFIVKGGGALWEGKTMPVNELVLSADKRLDIPLKLIKAVGLSLDPDPSPPGLNRPLPQRPRMVALPGARPGAARAPSGC